MLRLYTVFRDTESVALDRQSPDLRQTKHMFYSEDQIDKVPVNKFDLRQAQSPLKRRTV